MHFAACSTSRSLEEAAKDVEWPGPPVAKFRQLKIPIKKRKRKSKSAPPSPIRRCKAASRDKKKSSFLSK